MRLSAKTANWTAIGSLVLLLFLGLAYGLFLSLLPSPVPTIPRPRQLISDAAYQARVIGVSDGDTITVRVNRETVKIRLAQIDAPERGQAWGQKSREALVDLVAGETITVQPLGQDRYGRTIGELTVNGRDVNRDMVARGAAWAYPDYVRDQTIVDIQARARDARLGLWALSQDQLTPPWEYRAQQRKGAGVSVGR